jgi:hypothetical protein
MRRLVVPVLLAVVVLAEFESPDDYSESLSEKECGGETHSSTDKKGASNNNNLVAAVIAMFSSVISNCGTNIQKKSHVQNNLLPPEKQKAYVLRKLWWLGMSGVIGGAIGDFAALGIGNQALVTGLGGGCTLIANVGFSHYWNGDQLFNSDVLGILFVLAGAGLFALASPPAADYTVAQLKGFFADRGFIIYFAVELMVIACLLATIASSSFYKWRVRLQRAIVKGGIRELEVRPPVPPPPYRTHHHHHHHLFPFF